MQIGEERQESSETWIIYFVCSEYRLLHGRNRSYLLDLSSHTSVKCLDVGASVSKSQGVLCVHAFGTLEVNKILMKKKCPLCHTS